MGMMAPLAVPQQAGPVLHLSGARLRAALAALTRASEAIGGIEQFAAAARLRAELFQERLGDGRAATIERARFEELVRFMPTVRRRIGPLIEGPAWATTRVAITTLLADAHVPGTADRRIDAFCASLPDSPSTEGARTPRHLRDLAAELLHAVLPEHYPLMTRWVWDARANTGALREIWHDPVAGEDTNGIVIDVADTHETFLVLRQELSQFLSDEGMFRDVLWYVDLLLAHVYARYINDQGGAYLKADFAAEGDPLEHTRRMLGLDGRRVSRE